MSVVNSWNEWDPLREVIVGSARGAADIGYEPALSPYFPRGDAGRSFRGQPIPPVLLDEAERQLDDFATLAMKYSEDPETSGNGGDLGTVPESSLRSTDPSTRDAVMKLKPGQYSPIVSVVNPQTRQPVGYRIVKLVSKEPAGQREFSDPRVQEAVRSQLRDRREQLLKAAYYEVLRDQAKIENFYAEKILQGNGTAQ